jgi:hypothetical protein
VAVLVSVGIAASVVLTMRVRSHRTIPVAGGFTFTAIAVVIIAIITPPPLPSKTLTFPGTVLGSPVSASATTVTTAAVPLQGIGAGTFTLTTSYSLTGSASISGFCTTGTLAAPGPTRASATDVLQPGTAMHTVSLRCPVGLIWTRATVAADAKLFVATLTLRKVRN